MEAKDINLLISQYFLEMGMHNSAQSLLLDSARLGTLETNDVSIPQSSLALVLQQGVERITEMTESKEPLTLVETARRIFEFPTTSDYQYDGFPQEEFVETENGLEPLTASEIKTEEVLEENDVKPEINDLVQAVIPSTSHTSIDNATIIDANSVKQTKEIEISNEIYSFCRRQNILAFASAEHMLTLLNCKIFPETPEKALITVPEPLGITALSWSSIESLAIGTTDGMVITRFDESNVQKYRRHFSPVNIVKWNYECSLLASAEVNGVIVIGKYFNKDHSKKVFRANTSTVEGIEWLSADELVSYSKEKVVRYNYKKDELTEVLSENTEITKVMSSVKAKTYIVSLKNNSFRFFSIPDIHKSDGLQFNSDVNCWDWSPNGEFIAISTLTEVGILNVEQREMVHILQHNSPVNSLAFSVYGYWLATASADNSVNIWENNSRKCVAQWNDSDEKPVDKSKEINKLFWASKDKELIVGCTNNQLSFINLEDVLPKNRNGRCIARNK